MIQARSIRLTLWLTLLAGSAVGGWFFGRSLLDSAAPQGTAKVAASRAVKPVFTPASPQGLWMAAVKKAAPADFPKLLEEWETLFPEGEEGIEGRPENALRWIMAAWVLKDSEGFLRVNSRPEGRYGHWAAQVWVELMPEKAAAMLFDPGRGKLDESFVGTVASSLAELHPALYLKMNPHGTIDLTPGMSNDDWENAIARLAKTDAVAAANACLGWKVENDPSSIYQALMTVAVSWKTTDPSMKEWVNGIADPKLRNFAQHARLSALAAVDPRAALAELYSVKLEPDNDLRDDAPREILDQLAKADPVAALKLLKDVEGIFSKSKPSDPFADPFAAPSSEPSTKEEVKTVASPFSDLSPGRYGGELENNGVRRTVLAAAVENLPDEPNEFFKGLHQLTAATGSGDSTWQRSVAAGLIRLKSDQWSAEDCLTVSSLWAAEVNTAPDDLTLQTLAARAAKANPDAALATLDQLPESARPAFAAEIIKQLPASDPDERIALFSHLTAAQWDEKLGAALGGNAAAYALVIASLPAATTVGARESFMNQWGDQDPEAAARWLASLPNDAASKPAAKGLVGAWASYDEFAASAWAARLPPGPVRDGAANSLAQSLVKGQPVDAWHWAASISDPQERAKVLGDVAYYWDDATDEFRVDLAKARQAAGIPEKKAVILFEDSFAPDPFK